jgi:putative inorganic carbon (hco3(-)) transporter
VLRSLFIFFVYCTIFVTGIGVPFVLTLGYVWVDMFRPGDVVYPMLRGIPYSLLIGIAAVGSYILVDRRAPPRVGAVTVLSLLLAFWVTLTTFWAVAPDEAWIKWDWAFKSILFSVFIPFVIRTRNHIEAFLQVFVFSVSAQFIAWGTKVLLGGGGYEQALGMARSFFLGNGEILSGLALACVALMLFLMKHGRIFPNTFLVRLGYMGLIVLAMATVIGTHARTGLVAMAVFAVVLWSMSRRKLFYAALLAAGTTAIVMTAPVSWTDRMATIFAPAEERDTSSAVRIAVWKWTLDFVSERPFGGGFSAWTTNRIVLSVDPDTGEEKGVQEARAFHSSFFEVLGEHGWVGFALFMSIILLSFRSLFQVSRFARSSPDLLWLQDLSTALFTSFTVLLAAGAFTDMAFHPTFYYMIALCLSLRQYVFRMQLLETDRRRNALAEGPLHAFPAGPR